MRKISASSTWLLLTNTENKIHVLIFSKLLSEIFLIVRIIDRDILTNTETPSRKLPVILVKF